MSKQKAPTLLDFARSKSDQPIITINLVALVLLVLVLFISLATGSFDTSAGGIFSIFLILSAIAGITVSTILISRQGRNLEIEKGNKASDWAISRPEKQRNKVNREVREVAETMEIPDEQYSDLVLAYIVAEDLALRNVQQVAEQPLIRHAKIGETEFDAILLSQNLITCVEVTFLVEPKISDDKLDLIKEKLTAAQKVVGKKYPGSNLKLLLFIVFQLNALDEAKLRSVLIAEKDRFAAIPINYFEIELRSFEELQKIYTMD